MISSYLGEFKDLVNLFRRVYDKFYDRCQLDKVQGLPKWISRKYVTAVLPRDRSLATFIVESLFAVKSMNIKTRARARFEEAKKVWKRKRYQRLGTDEPGEARKPKRCRKLNSDKVDAEEGEHNSNTWLLVD